MKNSRHSIRFASALVMFLFVSICVGPVNAESMWTWMSGSAMLNQQATYGTLGTPDAANIPGARDGSIAWTDSHGDLWAFGGFGYDSEGASGNLNDLWRYSIDTGEWTWESGADTIDQKGVYGVPGVPDAANIPGARDGSIAWADSDGNLWAFGGWGYDSAADSGMMNDVWRYTPATGTWTWMGGADTAYQAGTYGTKGLANGDNVPGARYWGVSWYDSTGNFWLFGGYGLDANTNEGDLNDLWRYCPSTGEWTWVSGSDIAEQAGIYGTQGVASDSNFPGGRETGVSWTDNDGNLWLFGGYGLDKNGDYGFLNDLWRYSPATGEWAWMNGSDTIDAPGIYGVKGVPDSANTPCARFESISWTDNAGNLWLFGGWGRVCGNPAGWGSINDLWRYSPYTGEWTWMAGESMTNRPGVYGTLGIADAANVPGSRQSSIAWTDSAGDLWLFGGIGFVTDNSSSGKLNDLWRYDAGSLPNLGCPEGYVFLNGTCQLDQPPEFLCGPVWSGYWVPLSSDPANPHRPGIDDKLFWAVDDDLQACSSSVINRFMYRPVELQAGQVVPLGDWVVKQPDSYLWWAWIIQPGIAEISGPGLFEFKMTVTDCMGQMADSETFFGARYYFQVD